MIREYMKQLKENADDFIEGIDIILCTVLYGASPNNYKSFEYKKLNTKQRKTYVTYGLSKKMIKTFNDKSYIHIFEDKTEFATRFDKYFGRQWVPTEDLTFEQFKIFNEAAKGHFIYKPVEEAQGQGIIVFEGIDDIKSCFEQIKRAEKGILEQWILQHSALNEVYDKAINCLRIITVTYDNKVKFLSGGVTWGNGGKIANASATGIVSPINFRTGVLEKPAADFLGNVYYYHPVTGAKLIDFKMPYWKETVKMIRSAAREIPQIGYVGWDIAITPDGPIIIEGNTTPGYKYYQIPVHMENHLGNRAIYQTCLHKAGKHRLYL